MIPPDTAWSPAHLLTRNSSGEGAVKGAQTPDSEGGISPVRTAASSYTRVPHNRHRIRSYLSHHLSFVPLTTAGRWKGAAS